MLITVPEITVILFTRGLHYVQCSKNRMKRENYIANNKTFHEHQLHARRFPGFPGVVVAWRSGLQRSSHEQS